MYELRAYRKSGTGTDSAGREFIQMDEVYKSEFCTEDGAEYFAEAMLRAGVADRCYWHPTEDKPEV